MADHNHRNAQHDGVWATTADDIAEYYLASYYDEVKSWIAERNTRVLAVGHRGQSNGS
jgi:hypothetical protein